MKIIPTTSIRVVLPGGSVNGAHAPLVVVRQHQDPPGPNNKNILMMHPSKHVGVQSMSTSIQQDDHQRDRREHQDENLLDPLLHLVPGVRCVIILYVVFAIAVVVGFRVSHFLLGDCEIDLLDLVHSAAPVHISVTASTFLEDDEVDHEDEQMGKNSSRCHSYYLPTKGHKVLRSRARGGVGPSSPSHIQKLATEQSADGKNGHASENTNASVSKNNDRIFSSMKKESPAFRIDFPSGYWVFRKAPKDPKQPSKKEKGIQNVQWRWREWHKKMNYSSKPKMNSTTTVQPLLDLSPERVAKCIKDKPIVFSGDSTTRHVVHDMIRFFLENSTMAPSEATKRKWGDPGPFYHYETPSNTLNQGFGAYHGARDKFTQKVDMWIKDRCRDPESAHFVSAKRSGETKSPACWSAFEKNHGLKFHKCRKYNATANEPWSRGFWPDPPPTDPSKNRYWCPNARFGTADLTWKGKATKHKGVQIDLRQGPFIHDAKNDVEFWRPYLKANRPALIFLNRGTHDYRDVKPKQTTEKLLRSFQIRLAKTLCLIRENFDGPIVWRHNYDWRPTLSAPMDKFRKAGREVLFGDNDKDNTKVDFGVGTSTSGKNANAHTALSLSCNEVREGSVNSLLSRMSGGEKNSLKPVLWPNLGGNVFEIDAYSMTENQIANQAFFADGYHFPQKVSRIIWQHLASFLCA